MSVAERIKEKLTKTLNPTQIEVIDESHLHAGHASAPEGGESHFRALIVSEKFEGVSQVARQRLVYAALTEEMAGPIHALSLKTLSPKEV